MPPAGVEVEVGLEAEVEAGSLLAPLIGLVLLIEPVLAVSPLEPVVLP